MIGVNGIVISDEMHEAGLRITSDMYDATIQKAWGGDGGCKILNMDNFPINQDLIKKYLDKELDSVQAIYLAMIRVKR